MSTTTQHIETTPATGLRVLTAIIAMSLPVVINNVSRTAMNFVDFAMVSKLGLGALAAITPAMTLLYCIIGLGLGTTVAVTTFASQSLGRDRPLDAATYAWQAVVLGVLFGLLTLPLISFASAITGVFGHAENVHRFEVDYFQWALLSAGPTAVAYALTHFFVAVHRPWLGCVATIIANAFNVLADWVLIFGHWGFPEMGIKGAAVATTLATVLQCAILLAMFWSRSFRREYATHRAMRLDRQKLAGILRVGVPIGVQFAIDIASWTAFVAFVIGTRFGTVQLAATNIVFQCLHISFMPAIGIGTALSAMVGKSIGRRDHDLAARQTRWATALCMGYMGLCGLFFLVGRYPLLAIFTDNTAVIEVGAVLFICAAIFQAFDGLGISAMNALRGAGDAFWPALYASVLTWGVQIGGGLLIGTYWPSIGAVGPWMMCTVYIIVLGIVLWRRFGRGDWRRVDIFREPSSSVAEAAPPPIEPTASPAPAVVPVGALED